jgi:putative DNA primase/helicase
VIVAQPGITLTGLQECWKRKRTKEVKASLERLMNLAPPLVEQRKDDTTGGRAALRFHAYGKR